MEFRPSFIYPDIKESDYLFGSNQLAGLPLREDGDWREFLPNGSDQNVNGVESSSCYIQALQHAIATIEEETFGEINNDYSARFNALLSGGSVNGGDPLKGAESIRKDGLVPESAMPFLNINSWTEYHSWKGVAEAVVRALGKRYLMTKRLGYDIVFQRHESVSNKYLKAKQALKYSPLPVSVCAWLQKDGVYVKPEGSNDNHLVLLVHIDDQNRPYIWDTYAPYLKILAPNYSSDFCMRVSVEKLTEPEQLTYLSILLSDIMQWLKVYRSKLGSLLGL